MEEPSPTIKQGEGKRPTEASDRQQPSITIPLPRWLKTSSLTHLKEKFVDWLNAEDSPSDRRRAPRNQVPGVVAFYWNGGAPKEHKIADISATGFYMLTEDRWVPETMMQMTLQRTPAKNGRPKQSIAVLTKVVRRGVDGVGHEFVLSESLDRNSREVLPAQGTDKQALERFL